MEIIRHFCGKIYKWCGMNLWQKMKNDLMKNHFYADKRYRLKMDGIICGLIAKE